MKAFKEVPPAVAETRPVADHGDDAARLDEHKKKERLLTAAIHLFADKGYAGTSVREIAEVAGVTKPVLYYYFKNKEDLYRQLMDEAMATFFTTLGEALSGVGAVRPRLIRCYVMVYELFRENIDFLRLINSVIYGPVGATPRYDLRVRNEELECLFAEILREGVANGELSRDCCVEVKMLLVSLLRSIQANLVLEPGRDEFGTTRISRLIDLIFNSAGSKRTRKGGRT